MPVSYPLHGLELRAAKTRGLYSCRNREKTPDKFRSAFFWHWKWQSPLAQQQYRPLNGPERVVCSNKLILWWPDPWWKNEMHCYYMWNGINNRRLYNLPINQSIDQSIDRKIDSINQSIDRKTNSIKQSIKQCYAITQSHHAFIGGSTFDLVLPPVSHRKIWKVCPGPRPHKELPSWQ